MNYFSLTIPALIVSPLLLVCWDKRNKFSIGFLTILFIVTCLAFAPYSMQVAKRDFIISPVEPMFFFGICWFLWLFPLVFIKKNVSIEDIATLTTREYDFLYKVTLITCGIATLLLINNFTHIYAANIDLIRVDAVWDARLHTRIGIQLCSFFPFSAFLLFLGLSFYNLGKWKTILLLFASICEPLHVLVYYGRDGFIQWFLLFGLSFSMFFPFIPTKKRNGVVLIILLLSLCFIVSSFVISLSRKGGNIGIAFSDLVLDYFIHEPKNFVAVYDIENSFSYKPLVEIFPFAKFFDSSYDPIEASIRTDQFQRYFITQYGYHPNVFSSFVGNLCFSFGRTTCMIISIVASLLVSLFFKFAKKSVGYYFFTLFYSFSLLFNYFYLRYSMGIQPWIMVGLALLFCIYFSSPRDTSTNALQNTA